MRNDDTKARRRIGPEAERPGKGAAGRDRARPPGGAKRPRDKTARRQFHLSEQTAQRLGVHCSLVDRNESAIVEEILATWLARFGKGRELWQVSGGREDSSPDTQEDRQDTTAA
jgi:hypothetical protein